MWQQSSATLSRWRQSPRSPTAPSHLTPHLYWNLNDTICALPRCKVWIWHFEFTIWNLVRFGASPSEDQYWSVNDTIWDPWKAPPWREDNKAEIIRLLQLIQLSNPLNICSLDNKGKNKDLEISSVFLNKDLSLKYIQLTMFWKDISSLNLFRFYILEKWRLPKSKVGGWRRLVELLKARLWMSAQMSDGPGWRFTSFKHSPEQGHEMSDQRVPYTRKYFCSDQILLRNTKYKTQIQNTNVIQWVSHICKYRCSDNFGFQFSKAFCVILYDLFFHFRWRRLRKRKLMMTNDWGRFVIPQNASPYCYLMILRARERAKSDKWVVGHADTKDTRWATKTHGKETLVMDIMTHGHNRQSENYMTRLLQKMEGTHMWMEEKWFWQYNSSW